ncbi:hemerythrin domain-containing protein [Chelativorans sp.]|uniref:hemerythrin domain-containing protein n=1 Tax=Chelativorans sp. TaxID=2203393 RepID=UPI0028126432|nr:hemerythrin domain-containing protein [Chelativorans sp.]
MTFTIDLLDDRTRPKAPKVEGVTPAQRAHGKRLAMIHNLHLQQMAEVRRVMERIAAGEESVASLGDAVSSLQMAHNYRQFGALCGRECVALTFHHTSEDQLVFPALERGSEGLRKVVERLRAEHDIIHQILVQYEAAALEAMEAPGPETFAALRELFETLDRVVKSHFGYEQEELEEALGYMNVPL